ncbi:MoxR family ATPase [Paenalcaligenes niemegkensis]|uniref:AAA family ATPase n=1 Tax=Paenalcaligenes niemegkensis TaxID=2895469 RepID=UPI001EE8AD05|nr:MoxR family ATPase [Paenalcaligenes niemegkensis]MCQ9615718.1 MoxR family ATPase [Paenalcaligenes niemegkensis]
MENNLIIPERKVSIKETFGFDSSHETLAFAEPTDYVPKIDHAYKFDPDVTLSLLAGFNNNRRVLVQGRHGTGKSTHIEQVAARLNWPCMRVNLDGHISRLDLVGKDTIRLKDGLQVTAFQEGVIPWALQRPIALIFDEYDAGRPDVMFVIQQILEQDGRFTMLDQNRVLTPHPYFRLFATSNTVGLGDSTGLYRGTHHLNHAQMDRWNIVANLNYMEPAQELSIVLGRVPSKDTGQGRQDIAAMVALANLTRNAFAAGDISTLMSPRTVITWAENCTIFKNRQRAFVVSFLNKCDESEHMIVAELYQRCFNEELAL